MHIDPGKSRLELPHYNPPLLNMFMDQCAVQVSALNFLIFFMQACILVWEDCYHREWNDVKAVARLLPKFWRCILHLKVALCPIARLALTTTVTALMRRATGKCWLHVASEGRAPLPGLL